MDQKLYGIFCLIMFIILWLLAGHLDFLALAM